MLSLAEPAAGLASLHGECRWLQGWLVQQAMPLWSRAGVDGSNGSFHEALDEQARPLALPRRARVHPRQAYAFARAQEAGWRDDALPLVESGLVYFRQQFQRADGLYRTLVRADGEPLDDAVLLYDQAFVLLGASAAHRLSGQRQAWQQQSLALLDLLRSQLGRADGGFDSGLPARQPLLANPHMHLLEAALDWREVGTSAEWGALADRLGTLALERLIDARSGLVHEVYAPGWQAAPGVEGRLVEPGHLYEWAALLLRWQPRTGGAAHAAATRLVDQAERHCLRNGLAIDAVLDDFSVHLGTARLWPQAERLKAHALLATLGPATQHVQAAVEAARALRRYLDTPVPGLWFDQASPDGQLLAGHSPASSLYHIVSAWVTLAHCLGGIRS